MPNVMATLPNIGGALCESSVIPFLETLRQASSDGGWAPPFVRAPAGPVLPFASANRCHRMAKWPYTVPHGGCKPHQQKRPTAERFTMADKRVTRSKAEFLLDDEDDFQ